MVKALFLAATFALAAPSASAQDIVTGDAGAGLVSRMARGEVHLIADPALNDRRLVLKIVVLNLSAQPQSFGPEAVTVVAGDAHISLMSRGALIAEQTGSGTGSDETAQAHAAASLPTNAAGQTDVSGYTGGMGGVIAGVPPSSVNRSQRRSASAAALDAVLLKPMTIRPNAADGGQVMTEKLRRSKMSDVVVAVGFAGDVHRFRVKVPR
jgi:hypothetical protein